MNKNKILRLIGASGVAGLGILVFILLSCPNISSASAVDEYTGIAHEVDAMVGSENRNADARVWVKPSISIALGATLIDLDSTKAVNNFIYGTANLKVATNSTRGFQVLMHSNVNANLVATDDSSKFIPPIAAKLTSSEFPENSAWGYYADSGEPTASSTYYPASTTASVIKSTDTSSAINNYRVGVGIKVDSVTPIGIYQNQIVVSAVANPISAFNLASITRMQDMTPDVCAATPEYVSTSNYAWKTLVDDRVDNDGNKKSYKVAKLADGNCWMVENLAYSLGKEMTSADTDLAPGAKKTISSGWWHPNSYWYYDWNVATAGSGASATTDGARASDSICPKGWQLPLAGTKYNTITTIGNPTHKLGSGSYYDLLMSHNIANQAQMVSVGAQSPLSFFPAGYVTGSGSAGAVAQNGAYWSGVAVSNTTAYRLYWYTASSDFVPSYVNERTIGFSVRCVARQVAR